MIVNYFNIKNKVLTMVNQQMPFKITEQKCQSYLDLHYPDLQLTDLILKRCCYIFNTLLKYADGYIIHNDKTIIWSKLSGWLKPDGKPPVNIFNKIFYNETLSIVNSIYSINKKITLNELLIDDQKFYIFKNYWTSLFNYGDLFKLLNDISIKINFELPHEIIHKILMHAYAQRKKLQYID